MLEEPLDDYWKHSTRNSEISILSHKFVEVFSSAFIKRNAKFSRLRMRLIAPQNDFDNSFLSVADCTLRKRTPKCTKSACYMLKRNPFFFHVFLYLRKENIASRVNLFVYPPIDIVQSRKWAFRLIVGPTLCNQSLVHLVHVSMTASNLFALEEPKISSHCEKSHFFWKK